jgi:hypothetical protein
VGEKVHAAVEADTSAGVSDDSGLAGETDVSRVGGLPNNCNFLEKRH